MNLKPMLRAEAKWHCLERREHVNPKAFQTENEIYMNLQKYALFRTHISTGPELEVELELIQTQMAQKPMLRAEVGMRVRCANKASAE